MKQELTNTIKAEFYYCPVCNEPIKATEASKYVCFYCKHKLEVTTRTDMGITYSELLVCKESVYCPNCSHALKIELPASSKTHNLYKCHRCQKTFKEIVTVDYTKKHNESMIVKMFTLFVEEVC